MKRIARSATFAVVILLLAACQKPADQAATARTLAAAPTEPARPAASPAGPDRGVTPIVSLDTIGVTKEFIERTLGKSTYETPDEANYKVGGCDVRVEFDQDKAVRLVNIDLKPGCAFDAAGLTGSNSPLPVKGPMTFAAFEKAFGQVRYLAPCLHLCGNAYDPYVDAVILGSHANGVVDISAHADFVDDTIIHASNAWKEKLVSLLGEDYVDNTRYNCEREHDDIARAAFAEVPIGSLQFGRDIGSTDCT